MDRRSDVPEEKTSYKYVLELRERLDSTMKMAQEELKRSQGKNKRLYDRKTRKRAFEEGDKVLVLLPTDHNKLLMQWRGPYVVKGCPGGNNYRIEIKGKPKNYHINMLKQYVEREEVQGPVKKNDRGVPGGNVQGPTKSWDGRPKDSDDQEPVHVGTQGSVGGNGQGGSVEVGVQSAKVGDPEIDFVGVCVGGPESQGELSVDEDELLELGGCQQREDVRDVKLGLGLSEGQQEEILGVLGKYSGTFTDVPGKTNLIEHHIKLTDDDPVRSKPYPLPYAVREELRGEIRDMVRLGIIQDSNSPYASPIVIVKKKDGSNRICVDYRKLNKLTVADPEPMSTAGDLFQRFGKSRYFSKIDLSKGYWQVPVAAEDVPKTAFVTPDGCYEFLRMPFGMKNSGATLVRGMRQLLSGMEHVDSYIDDLIIYTEDWDSHLQVLEELLSRLEKANLSARPTKCLFGTESIEFLGHQVGSEWITVNDDNLDKIRNAKRPTTKKEVRSFLGLVNYYREHIPSFATIAAPLSDLTKKGLPNRVQWGDAQERAFATLQEKLLERPILRLPDHSRPFVLRTDASNCGLGAALMQKHGEKYYPVGYRSKKLTPAESRYSTMEKECLAIVWGVTKFRLFLAGKPFVLQTDHQPLAFLNKAKFQNDRIMRWALALQGYDFRVEDIPGVDNVVADYLSRLIDID